MTMLLSVVGVCRMVLTACCSWAGQIDGKAMRQDAVNGAATRRSWAASNLHHSTCIHYPFIEARLPAFHRGICSSTTRATMMGVNRYLAPGLESRKAYG